MIALFTPSIAEMVLVVGVILLFFGGKLFVKWGKSLGQTRKELNKLQEDNERDIDI